MALGWKSTPSYFKLKEIRDRQLAAYYKIILCKPQAPERVADLTYDQQLEFILEFIETEIRRMELNAARFEASYKTTY